MTIVFKFLQYLKASFPISVTPSGIVNSSIEPKFLKHFHAEAEKFIKENHLQITPEGKAILTHSGIFISDYIMRELMI